jgi:hypothetical protein
MPFCRSIKKLRRSVYVLYSYKSTNTDEAAAAAGIGTVMGHALLVQKYKY